MGMFRSIDISSSGLTAQRMRMDLIANNIANVNSTRTQAGGAYRRQMPIFQARENRDFAYALQNSTFGRNTAGGGVRVARIVEDPSPLLTVYDPNHPDADANGYVQMPNVNIVNEMVDMISATRAYEANATSVDSAKKMFSRALEIGRG